MSKFIRVTDPADPRRCQGTTRMGQCPFLAEEGSQSCLKHGAHVDARRAKVESVRNYRLAKWQSMLDQHVANPNIKSLREEIGILRVMVQEKISLAKDSADLNLMSGSLSALITQVTKAVQACHGIEKELGQLIDKTQALVLAQNFVRIIGQYIDDPDILAFISDDLIEAVDQAIDPEDKL